MEPRPFARLAPAGPARARRRAGTGPRPQPPLRRAPRPVGARLRRRAGSPGSPRTTSTRTSSPTCAAVTRTERRAGLRGQPLAGRRATGTGSACPTAGRWREVLNTDSSRYGGSDVGNLGGVEAEEIAWHGPAVLGRDHPAAAGCGLVRARTLTCDGGASAARPRSRYPWELPLGRDARRDGTTVFRVWAPSASDVARANRRLRPRRCGDEGHGVRSSDRVGASTATTTGSCSTATRCPTRARAGSPTGSAGPSRVLDPRRVHLERRRLSPADRWRTW